MNVLVTGGAGFIGSHVVDKLLADGHQVAALDDLSGGSARYLPPNVRLFQANICDLARVQEVVSCERWSTIIHCAAQIKVSRSMEDPVLDREVNLVGTANVLTAARAHSVDRFVFLSTGGAIYGDTPLPASEETLPNPMSYYAVHKLAAEAYVNISAIPAVNLRLANVYGPRQRTDVEGGVVAIFAERLLRGEEVIIHGTGEQAFDFIYVSDVVEAVRVALDHQLTGTFNVGTGTLTSLNEILATLVEITGRAPTAVRHDPPRLGAVTRSVMDIGKLVGTGLWAPRHDLRVGLTELVASLT